MTTENEGLFCRFILFQSNLGDVKVRKLCKRVFLTSFFCMSLSIVLL